MENKILTQELNLIDDLLQLVNTKEEYDDLVARAKEIFPQYISPVQRQKLELLSLSLLKRRSIKA